MRTRYVVPSLLLLAACYGDGTLAPGEGRVRVTLPMTGLDLDPDGAQVTVDGSITVPVATAGAVTIDLDPGRHTLLLGGLAPNCGVEGGASRQVRVREAGTTDVEFAATCGAAGGVIEVSVQTQGVGLDPNGYLVSVDNGQAQRVHDGIPSRFTAVPAGAHVLIVRDIAANCAVVGGNPVTGVHVNAGGPVRDTVRVAVTVSCSVGYGDLRLITTTNGPPDPDGYVILLGPAPAQSFRLAANDTLLLTSLPIGSYSIGATDLGGGCAIVGTPPTTVTIVGGSTVEMKLTVDCPMPAVLRVTAPTTGSDLDPSYLVRVDGGGPQALLPGGTLTLSVAPGNHSVELSDVAPNCTVAGANPVTVTVASGSTTDLQFAVSCVAPAILRITAPTTGASLDPSYLVRVDGGAPQMLLSGSTLSLGLTPGAHSVELSDIASNCTLAGANPVVVTLSTAAPTDLAFPVSCTGLPRTGLDLTISTTGNNPDDSYFLTICGDFYCYQTAYSGDVPANTTLQLDLAPGMYYAGLNDVASNCRVTTVSGWAVITAGQVTAVRIELTCVHYADLVASVTTTGADQQTLFTLSVDGIPAGSLAPGSPLTVTSLEGNHSIGLGSIQANCRVTTANPVSVALIAGVTTPVSFAVDCAPYPILNVTVSTTGSNLPTDFLLGLDPDWWYGYAYAERVTPNDFTTIRVGTGVHFVWLDQVAGNCTVNSENPVGLNVTLGSTTDVAFLVTCR